MTEHTKEPWNVNFTRIDGAIVRWHIAGKPYGSAYPVCEHVLEESLSDRGPNASEQIENARRIVACVNACAGIKTEKLEAVAFLSPHLPDGLKDKAIDYAELLQQRDKLLAALNDLLNVGDSVTFQQRARDKARVIIAEIEAAK